MTILRIALLAVCVGFSSTLSFAQEDAPPIRPILKLITFANLFINECPDAGEKVDRDVAQSLVDEAFAALAVALTDRAVTIGVAPSEASAEVEAYLSFIQRTPPNLSDILSRCPGDYSDMMSALRSEELKLAISGYGAATNQYDRPFATILGDAQSYASPFTQRRLFDSMRVSFTDCADVELVSVELMERRENETRNLPVFIKAPLTYRERWTLRCGGETRLFDAVHTRDSDRSMGNYSVSPVRE